MRLRVLGCHGGESPSHRASCFLINDDLLLDAGAAARGLSPKEQAQIDYVFLSHAHLDHIYGLPFLADNAFGARTQPIDVICAPPVATSIEKHIFNGSVWPDLTRIDNPKAPGTPVMRIRRLAINETLEAGPYRLSAVPVDHAVAATGVFVRTKGGTLAYSGDTGPTDLLWTTANEVADLRAIICEVSFPNALKGLAMRSGHLTPALLLQELAKLKPLATSPRILITHLKPQHADTIRQELLELHDGRVVVLRPMDELDI